MGLVVLLAAFIGTWAFGLELLMFFWMAALVSLGAATGRWAAQRRMSRTTKNAA
jgi:hypothetical protein